MYFSVKASVKILGKVYTPCVCYNLPEVLKPTIEKMAQEDKAYIFDEKVAFQNGKVLAKGAVVKENLTTETAKKSRKKAKEEKIEAEETEGF